MLALTTTFWRDHPAFPCLLSGTLSIAIGCFLFRPLGLRQLLGRCPLFLVTGGALMLITFANLPEALQSVFERYLGHSIYEMVYEQQSSGTIFGELWTNRWSERLGTFLECMILASAVWAIVNLSRKDAVRSNQLALLVVFGWVCLILWASSAMIL
jgi:hypothetical protein